MRIIGHRGASHVSPENTLAAVRLALDQGCGFEVDIQTLACGTLVVLHDDTLERTAVHRDAALNRSLVRRPIEELHWTDVKEIDVGSWFGSKFSSERVPLFSDVLRELVEATNRHGSVGDDQSAPHCFAELKAAEPFNPALPEAAAAAVEAARVPADALTWISFSRPLMVEMKKRTPQFAALHIDDARTSEEAWDVARECVRCGLDGIDLRALPEVVTPDLIEWLHARGKSVAVWVSGYRLGAPAKEDTPEIWDLLEARGVDDLTSNLPPTIYEWRRAREQRDDLTTAGKVAVASAASFALCRVVAGERIAEDVVDLVHSALATTVSARVAAAVLAEPGRLALSGPVDALARRFILGSSTYFACDAALVLCSLALGHRPRQWAGRLMHHAIQAAANLPALLCAPPAGSAVRRYLLLAYAAEISTIVLRLRDLQRVLGLGGQRAQSALHRALLASFALFRLALFPACTALIWHSRAQLPPPLLRLHLAFAAAGVTLSSMWFGQLLKQGPR